MSINLSVELLRLRVEAGLTQREAAARAGYHHHAVLHWERGATVPSVEDLVNLLQVYGKRLDIVDLHAPAPRPGPDYRRIPLDEERRKQLRALRERRRISRPKLAEALGVPTDSIRSYEIGRTTPTVCFVARWEAFLADRGAAVAA